MWQPRSQRTSPSICQSRHCPQRRIPAVADQEPLQSLDGRCGASFPDSLCIPNVVRCRLQLCSHPRNAVPLAQVVTSGANPISVKKGIDKTCDHLKAKLRELATPIKGSSDIKVCCLTDEVPLMSAQCVRTGADQRVRFGSANPANCCFCGTGFLSFGGSATSARYTPWCKDG